MLKPEWMLYWESTKRQIIETLKRNEKSTLPDDSEAGESSKSDENDSEILFSHSEFGPYPSESEIKEEDDLQE